MLRYDVSIEGIARVHASPTVVQRLTRQVHAAAPAPRRGTEGRGRIDRPTGQGKAGRWGWGGEGGIVGESERGGRGSDR